MLQQLNQDERKEIIDAKCAAAGCDEEHRERHFRLFVHERWDVHPPSEFPAWAKQFCPDSKPVTAWNCDAVRQQFYRSAYHAKTTAQLL